MSQAGANTSDNGSGGLNGGAVNFQNNYVTGYVNVTTTSTEKWLGATAQGISFVGSGFKPSTAHRATYHGVDVTSSCSGLTSSANGTISGSFSFSPTATGFSTRFSSEINGYAAINVSGSSFSIASADGTSHGSASLGVKNPT